MTEIIVQAGSVIVTYYKSIDTDVVTSHHDETDNMVDKLCNELPDHIGRDE